MTCEKCEFFTKRVRRETELEKWEADTRPVAPNFFAWFWNSQKYKDSHPYGDGSDLFDRVIESIDTNIIWYNENMGTCSRFPKAVSVTKDYICGEFIEK